MYIYMQEFLKLIFFQRSRQDSIGELARSAFEDVTWDGKLKSLQQATTNQTNEDAFNDAVAEFRKQRKKY